MKLRWVETALQTLLIFAAITAGYFIIFEYPTLAINKILSNTAYEIGKERSKIVRTNLLLQQLQSLNTSSANLENSHNRIIQGLGATSNNPPKTIRVRWIFAVTPKALKIKSELESSTTALSLNQKNVFNLQQKHVKQLLAFDAEIAQLYAYQPQNDLIRVDKPEKFELLSARANAAAKGIKNIDSNVNDTLLSAEIQKSEVALTELISVISTGNLTATEAARQAAILQLVHLQKLVLETQSQRVQLALQAIDPTYISSVGNFDSVLQKIIEMKKQLKNYDTHK